MSNTSSSRKKQKEKEEKEKEISKIEGRNLVFKRRYFNKFFTCGLCVGYFREAHTIRECLHTFCKSCIIKYLQTNQTCPTCSTHLGAHPLKLLKFDRAIQQLQDKIYPEVKEEDEKREREFFQKKGLSHPDDVIEERPTKRLKTSDEEENKTEEENEGTTEEKKEEKKEKKEEQRSVSFKCLPYQGKKGKGKGGEALPSLAKNFITTSADVSIKHVKKFINSQLKGEGLKDHEIDILYQDAIMGAEHTLEYIIRTHGIVYRRDECLTFHYRKSKLYQ